MYRFCKCALHFYDIDSFEVTGTNQNFKRLFRRAWAQDRLKTWKFYDMALMDFYLFNIIGKRSI